MINDESNIFISFEGGFNFSNNETSHGQELYSPVLRFPSESIASLYKKITDERLVIEMDGMFK